MTSQGGSHSAQGSVIRDGQGPASGMDQPPWTGRGPRVRPCRDRLCWRADAAVQGHAAQPRGVVRGGVAPPGRPGSRAVCGSARFGSARRPCRWQMCCVSSTPTAWVHTVSRTLPPQHPRARQRRRGAAAKGTTAASPLLGSSEHGDHGAPPLTHLLRDQHTAKA